MHELFSLILRVQLRLKVKRVLGDGVVYYLATEAVRAAQDMEHLSSSQY